MPDGRVWAATAGLRLQAAEGVRETAVNQNRLNIHRESRLGNRQVCTAVERDTC